MTDLKEHINARAATGNLLTRRFSHHPERYFEIFWVFRAAVAERARRGRRARAAAGRRCST